MTPIHAGTAERASRPATASLEGREATSPSALPLPSSGCRVRRRRRRRRRSGRRVGHPLSAWASGLGRNGAGQGLRFIPGTFSATATATATETATFKRARRRLPLRRAPRGSGEHHTRTGTRQAAIESQSPPNWARMRPEEETQIEEEEGGERSTAQTFPRCVRSPAPLAAERNPVRTSGCCH